MYIDAHAHLDGYDEIGPGALDAALAEIERLRIFTIANAMDPASYRRNLEIAGRSRLVLPVFGVHPWNAHLYPETLDSLREAAERSPAFGEIGLDHFFVKDAARYPTQAKVFEFFLAEARRTEQIVTVHAKGAEREVLEAIDRSGIESSRVVIHWYSGPMDILREMIRRGFFFTVGGEIMRVKRMRTIAAEIPAGRLLTETDNPGGSATYLGRPGTPALIEEIVRALAVIRGLTPEELGASVRANLITLFSASPPLAEVLRVIRETP